MVQGKKRKEITDVRQLHTQFGSERKAIEYLDGVYIPLGVGEGPVEPTQKRNLGPRTRRGNRPEP